MKMDLFAFVSTLIVFNDKMFISRVNAMLHYYLEDRKDPKKTLVKDISDMLDACICKVGSSDFTENEVASFLNLFEVFSFFEITPKFETLERAVDVVKDKLKNLGIPRCFFRPFFKVLLRVNNKSLDGITEKLVRIGELFPDQEELPDRLNRTGFFPAVRLQKAVKNVDRVIDVNKWTQPIITTDSRMIHQLKPNEFVSLVANGLDLDAGKLIYNEKLEIDSSFPEKCQNFSYTFFERKTKFPDAILSNLIALRCISREHASKMEVY